MVDMPCNTPLEKTVFLFCQWVSISSSILDRGRTHCPLLPLSDETVSSLNLCRSYECCHSLCESFCTSVLLCLGFQQSMLINFFVSTIPYRSLSPKSKSLMKTCHSVLLFQNLPLSAHCLLVILYVNSHVLQKITSHKDWERHWSMDKTMCYQ